MLHIGTLALAVWSGVAQSADTELPTTIEHVNRNRYVVAENLERWRDVRPYLEARESSKALVRSAKTYNGLSTGLGILSAAAFGTSLVLELTTTPSWCTYTTTPVACYWDPVPDIIAVSVGVASLGGSIAFLVLSDNARRQSTWAYNKGVRVGMTPTTTGAMVSLNGRF